MLDDIVDRKVSTPIIAIIGVALILVIGLISLLTAFGVQTLSRQSALTLESIRAGVVLINAILTSLLTLALVTLYYVMADTQKSQLALSERLNPAQLSIPPLRFLMENPEKDQVDITVQNHGQEVATDLHLRMDGGIGLDGTIYEFTPGVEVPVHGGVEIIPTESPLREHAGGDLAVDSLSSGGVIGPGDKVTFRSNIRFIEQEDGQGQGISTTNLLDAFQEEYDGGIFHFQISLIYRDGNDNIQVKPFQQGHLALDEKFQWPEADMSSFGEAVTNTPTSGGSMGWRYDAQEIKQRVENSTWFSTPE